MKAFDVLDVNCRLYFFFILFPSPLCLQNKITVCSGASLVIGEYSKVEFTKKRVCSFPTFFSHPYTGLFCVNYGCYDANSLRMYTVLDLRIFREIVDLQNRPFWHFDSFRILIFCDFFSIFKSLKMTKIKICEVESVKRAGFETHSQKSISRKIWLAEKFLNFHTVLYGLTQIPQSV